MIRDYTGTRLAGLAARSIDGYVLIVRGRDWRGTEEWRVRTRGWVTGPGGHPRVRQWTSRGRTLVEALERAVARQEVGFRTGPGP